MLQLKYHRLLGNDLELEHLKVGGARYYVIVYPHENR